MNPEYIVPFVMVVVAAILPLSLVPVMVWAERKISAFVQDRTGPNRADVFGIRLGGLIHPIADVVKLLSKEEVLPYNVSRFYFVLGPFLALFVPMLTFAIIPLADSIRWGGSLIEMRGITLNVGILFILSVTSFHVYAVVFGGWASNNSYSLLGGLRSAAQMVSYELGLGLSIIGLIMVSQTLDLGEIVQKQGGTFLGFLPAWNLFVQPVGFFVFLVSIFAETNRNPFDLPEGESEIIGYHVEYSSMKFAMYFMGEYIAVVGAGAVAATLYFGGWQVPFLSTETLRENSMTVLRLLLGATAAICLVAALLYQRYNRMLTALYRDRRRNEAKILGTVMFVVAAIALAALLFVAPLPDLGGQFVVAAVQLTSLLMKILAFSFFFIWVRWTLPRFRYDQLMGLGWKVLLPVAVLNIFLTGAVLVFVG